MKKKEIWRRWNTETENWRNCLHIIGFFTRIVFFRNRETEKFFTYFRHIDLWVIFESPMFCFSILLPKNGKTKNLDVSRTEVKFFTSLSWIYWNSFIQPKANISFRFSNDHIVMPCLIVLILYYSNLKICASAHFVHNNKCGTK